MHHNYTHIHSHCDRQSINSCDLSEVDSPPCPPCPPCPPWIKDLIVKKREKLVDIVNSCCVNAGNGLETENIEKYENLNPNPNSSSTLELTSREVNITCISSKSGSTSIGSNTSPHTCADSLTELCQSCQSCLCSCQCPDVPSQCESGFSISKGKAVHLKGVCSVNVPIVRSVSSSLLLTGRPCSRCLVSTCVDCLNRLHTSPPVCDSALIESNNTNKSNQLFVNSYNNSCTSKTNGLSEQQIIPGLVAQRKHQYLQRQVSECSYFDHTYHTCSLCGKIYGAINDFKNTEKMINEKVINSRNDCKSNSNHYEVIMDYKTTDPNNQKSSEETDFMDRDDNEYELQYGPGIVDKLKLKFMSISIQQQNRYLINNNLKRCSSLENLVVTNDLRHYPSQNSIPSHHYLSRTKPSQVNDIMCGKNGSIGVNHRSITDNGNKANGNQLSHRLYIQRHNNRNIYNSRSSAVVPVIKRAKSMETLLLQEDKDSRERGRQPLNNSLNHLLSESETPLSNQNDLHLLNDNVLICDSSCNKQRHNCANQSQSQISTDITSVGKMSNGFDNEMPKRDTVKTFKRIFEPNGDNCSEDTDKMSANNVINKTMNNFKKSQSNGASVANVKRKPPVLRASSKTSLIKSQTPVNSSPINKSQSLSPPVNQSLPTVPTVATPPNRTAIKKENDKNNNNNNNCHKSNESNKSANNCITYNTSNPSVRKPPIAPKRASLTLKANPLSGMTAQAISKSNKINGSIATNASIKSTKVYKNNSNLSSDQRMAENSLKSKSSEDMSCERKSDPGMSLNGFNQSSVCINNKSNTTNKSSDSRESTSNKSKVNKPIANIKPFTQSQSNGVLKSETVINGEQNDTDLGHDMSCETQIGGKTCNDLIENNIVINNNISNKNDNEINGNVFQSSLISSENCNSMTTEESNEVKKSNVNINDENVSPNTCDIMSDKIKDNSIQTTDVLKPSLLLNTENKDNSSKSAISSLWTQQNKKSALSSATTIVFDFRGKDVKSNLAIHPIPFGVVVPKKPINGSVNESDDDDNYTGSLDTPLPSGIIFMGENVVVGKGSLLLKRNKKLSLKFNESLTKTFEYPSESSLLAEFGITVSEDLINGETKSETNNSVIASESNNTNTSLTALKTNLALGGSQGGLGSYKPTLIDTPFELGVSRTNKPITNPDIITNDMNSLDNSGVDLIKPATADQTTPWSTSSTSDLLF